MYIKRENQPIWSVLFLAISFNYLFAGTYQDSNASNSIESKTTPDVCTAKTYRQGDKTAEVITWRDESAITILSGDRIVFRKAFFSNSGYNGSFIGDGAWSPGGSYFAFRLLSSGGHMPYRTPVKIVHIVGESATLLDAEAIIEKIPNISNIAIGLYKKPYLRWLTSTQLQVSVMSQDKESDSGLYTIDLDTLTAKKSFASETGKHNATNDLSVPWGTSKRKAIIDALRKEVKRATNREVVFVVKYLKAKDGWAWIHAFPQSKDGRNHYEDISALLNKHNGVWKVVEWPWGEEEDSEDTSDSEYFSNLKKRFPHLPKEILPEE